MKKVDFFIIGAPKCGTTSLHEYLKDHPHICFSDSKEPHYFSYDFPGYCTTGSLEEYHKKEFSHCNASEAILGEGSVWYLYSKIAVEAIYDYNPDAKILILLRDPVDMLQSLHSQVVLNLDEDVTIFEDAWYLQKNRANGCDIPKGCRVPEFLQYESIGKYSVQLERVFNKFPGKQVKVILFEDLKRDTKDVYASVLDFLEIEDDNRTEFQVSNQNKVIVSRSLATLLERPPKFVTFIVSFLKRALGVHRLGIYPLMNKLNVLINTKKQLRPELTSEFVNILRATFLEDVERTEKLIRRDLSSWKGGSRSGPQK